MGALPSSSDEKSTPDVVPRAPRLQERRRKSRNYTGDVLHVARYTAENASAGGPE